MERDFFVELASGLTVASLVGIFGLCFRILNLLKEKIEMNDKRHAAHDRLWSLGVGAMVRTDLLASDRAEYPKISKWKHT